MSDKQTAVRKHQKIQDSNKMMFIWIAGASAVVGFAAVISWFLWQQTMFKMKMASAKEDTVKVLRANNAAVETLRSDIVVLQTDSALLSSRSTSEENAVQVILDALPADANPLALGASLQEKLTSGVSGVKLESLGVDPVTADDALTADGGIGQIGFSMSVASNDPNKLTALLSRFEHSIRVIDIDSMRIERSTDSYKLSISAHAYYSPEKTITLEEEALE